MQLLKNFSDELEKFKEMNLTLTKLLQELMENKNSIPLAQPLPSQLQDSSTELMVDLGGSREVNREWAEKVVWSLNEPLKWKVDKILSKIFERSELLYFWFDKNRVKDSEGDKLFPEKCITLMAEFFDEANLKKAKMEILASQAKLTKAVSDKEQYATKCDEIYAQIMTTVETVGNADIRKQVGKVLYDCKTARRKTNSVSS